MKKIILILMTIGLLSSCSNDDDCSVNNEISGEWKLIEARIIDFSSNPSIDYSKENIIYNFQANGKLLVTGGNNVGYSNGEYEYIFGEDFLSNSPGPEDEMILLVKVNDNTKWTYNYSNGRMTLSNSFVDGPELIFMRK